MDGCTSATSRVWAKRRWRAWASAARVVTMVGLGGGVDFVGRVPLMGIRMGEGRPEEARRILRTGFCMLLAFFAGDDGAGHPAARADAALASARATRPIPCMRTPISPYLTGTVFALLAAGLNQMIIAQGFAAQAMRLVVLGAARTSRSTRCSSSR